MNKRTNPFYPPTASAASHPPYVPTAQQPPAPAAGGAQGYSQYWSQNGQYQQPTQSQWSSPAAPATSASAPPAPHATPEHANLYANYGYGGSHSLAWNNQAHNQPPSAPPAAPGPPATNQHQAIPIPYSSPYAPSQPAHPSTPQHAVHQHPPSAYAGSPTPQYHPSHPSPISHYNRQPPPPQMHQPPPPHMQSPVKRPRYDPPPQHQPLPQRFAPPPPPPPHRGPMHGGPPPAPMGPPPPQVSANMTPLGPRSGPGSTFVNGNYGGRGGARPPPMRGGGPMGPGPMNRGPMRGRGGGPMVNGRAMGGQVNQLRNGGARAQSGVQRRQAQRGGVGNAQRNAGGSVLASGKASLPNHPGVSSAKSSGAVSSAATAASAKRDDTRRTFTDFKIIGLELRGTEWRWGQKRDPPAAAVPEDAVSASASTAAVDATPSVASAASAETPVASTADPEQPVAVQNGAAPPSASSTSNLAACRIRIYFHNPKLEGTNVSSPLKLAGGSPLPRASKRKKADDDDDSVELESEQRARRPLPPHVSAQFEEASAVDGASVTGTEDAEEDWLMAVMADGSQDAASTGPVTAATNGHPVAAAIGAVTAMDTQSEGSHGQAASDWSEVVADPAATHDIAAEVSGSATISNDGNADGVEAESSAISNEHDVPASVTNGASPAAGEASVTTHEHVDEPMTPPAEERDPYQELMSPGSAVVDAAAVDESAQENELELEPEHEHEHEETDEHATIELADESSVGWNRLSIAYDGGSRRLIVASVAVKKLTIFRAEGRIEIDLVVTQRDEQQIEGIILESLVDRASQEHLPVAMSTDAATSDSLVPPFMPIATSTHEVTLIAYLDLDKPLSSAKWVKSNDLQEWLRMTAGKQAAVKTPDSWIGRIVVSDPDPPPNIHTVLDAWTHASNIGALPDRKTFVVDHLTNNISNILEVLLRMVRSDRAQAFTPAAVSQSAVHDQLGSNPLAEAMTLGSPLAKHQTHVSLAVLAMYKMLDDQAKKAGPEATAALATQIGELVRCLPQNQVYKSLDMMFKDVIHYKPKPKSGKA